MKNFPKYYIPPKIPDLTLNLFRKILGVEGVMELDKLIRWQYRREIGRLNYDDETTQKFFDGTLRKRD